MIIFGAPFRYYQGYGIIKNVGEVLAPMGKRFLVVSDAFVFGLLGETVDKAFVAAGRSCVRGLFSGESSDREIGAMVTSSGPRTATLSWGWAAARPPIPRRLPASY
ncbi:MAG: hypothetical protein LUC93_01725 [Planctomycetaceae bacterium]|nr:hypothetical protein [Planctomycetaceae bacterium]